MSRRPSLARLLPLLVAGAGCGLLRSEPPPALHVSGTVAYRERAALPAGAEVVVTIEDVSRTDAGATIVARKAWRPEGQVPLPFTLAVAPSVVDPRRSYSVRAQIRDASGRLLWTTTRTTPVLTRGRPAEVHLVLQHVPEPAAAVAAGVDAYDCEGLSFTVRTDADAARVMLPDRTLELPRLPSASGAKYGDADALFWSKGEEALLEVDARSYHGCRRNRARAAWVDAARRGVTFRALGNEPGWTLEIEPRRLVLVTDYGKRRIEMPAPPPARDGSETTYHARTAAHDLVVVVTDAPCQDDMSGEPFPAGVTLTLDGRTLRGCGREP